MARREVRSKLLVAKTEYIFWSRVLNLFHSSTALALCHAGVGFAFTNGWHESIFYTWAEGEYSCKAAGGNCYEQTTFHGRTPSPFHLDQGTGRWFTPAQVLEGTREQGSRGVKNVTRVAWI